MSRQVLVYELDDGPVVIDHASREQLIKIACFLADDIYRLRQQLYDRDAKLMEHLE